MQLELRHLRYFLAVAEELNFSRAAARLHIAQPALSVQIRTLENQLGCELFHRTTRKVELTPAGRLLLPDARDLVERADLAAAKLVAASRGQRGLLRVGLVAHGAGELSTAILRRFGEEYPGIEVELVEGRTLEGSQAAVAAQETDAGFVWLPILHAELEREPVACERKLVAMHPEHRLAAQRVVDVADLEEEPVVAPWAHYSAETIAYWLGPFRSARQPGDVFAESVDECMNYVVRGLAVYCVPESVERFYGRPDVTFRPLRGAEPAAVVLAWHREAQNPGVAPFVEVARALLAEQAEAPVPIESRRR